VAQSDKPVSSPGQDHHLEKLDTETRRRVENFMNALECFVTATIHAASDNDPDSMGNYHEGINLQDRLIELIYGTPDQPEVKEPVL
jgi:hypothetical protein